MKVNVTKAGHYAKVKGVLTELKTGEQDLSKELAESMVKNKWAVSLAVEDKEPSAADIVKLIKAAESLEQIQVYAEDERKTVKEAFDAKLAELSE